MDNDLGRFILHARERGLEYATIRALLLDAGWKDKQIAAALVDEALDLPVPHPRPAGSTKDAFLHVLSFAALYTWVISLIALLFTCIDVTWPDPAWPEYAYAERYVNSSIRWALAAIVVAYPVFLFLSRSLLRAMARDPERRHSRTRRWLTYFSLFIAAVTILSDLITLLYYAFEGELTARFLLKALVLFAVAGATFLYLALTLRNEQETTS